MAIAAVSDVEGRMRRPLSDDEVEDAKRLIGNYQGELEAILGRSVERRTFTETADWPLRTDRYYVRRGPIASVTSVTIGGIAQTTTNYRKHRDSIEFGPLWNASGFLWSSSVDLVVTYVGGHPPDVVEPAKAAVVARTCRMLNRHEDEDEGVKTSAVEGHTVAWEADEFTAAELAACSRLAAPDAAG